MHAAANDPSTNWADPAKLTSSELRQIAQIMEDKDFDLSQAIRKGQQECDGTVIMAQGKVVDAQEYAPKLETKHREDLDEGFKTGQRVVFEIACADENMNTNQVAVCPDTGEVKLVRASEMYGRDRYGRQVSDRERMERERRDFDEDRYGRRGDDERERAWDDWDADGRRHEFRERVSDRDTWDWVTCPHGWYHLQR